MNIVSFYSMPTNIEKLLSNQDYAYAVFHPKGVFRGIVEIIHSNPLHPQWHNLVIPVEDTDYAYVYTSDGWKKDNLKEEVWNQLFDEYLICFEYICKHKNEIISHLSDAKKMI